MVQNLSERVRYPKMRRRVSSTSLTEIEIANLIQQARTSKHWGVRNQAILDVLYSTGMTSNELRTLTLGMLDLDRGLVKVVASKKCCARTVPLTPPAQCALKRYLVGRQQGCENAQELVFPSQRGASMSDSALCWIVKGAGRKAGIRRNVGPMCIRHACVVHMLTRGARIVDVQRLLGYKKLGSVTRLIERVGLGIAELKACCREISLVKLSLYPVIHHQSGRP